MKANEFVKEFVKEFGWGGFLIACKQRPIDRYKYTIIWSDEIGFSNEINERDKRWTFESKEVKRLVKSYELVESKGGLDAAKNIVKSQHNLYTDMRLVQAISDVELCK